MRNESFDIHKVKKIVVGGYGWTGSSGVLDYLINFKNIYCIYEEIESDRAKVKEYCKTESKKIIGELNSSIEKQVKEKWGDKFNEDSILLLNNLIKCDYPNGIDMIKNADLFCVFRDPRSNWVAIMKERKKKEKNRIAYLDRFIDRYERVMIKFETLYKNCKKKEKIHIVQFEDFVLDKKVREDAARKAGLDLDSYPDNPKFKLWPKEKSILLHHYYEEQEEIKEIEKKLRKYLHPKV